MTRVLLVPVGLALLVVVNACGDSGGVPPTAPAGPTTPRPAAPSPSPEPPAAPAPATGTISFISSTPAFGALLQVRECVLGNVTRTCADGWSGAFSVSLDRDMAWPVLTVSFYEGAVLCGYAAEDQPRVSAGQSVIFRPSRIWLSDEFGTFSSPCQLPSTTTRMVAVLWSDADSTMLTQEFAGAFTFVRP